MKSRLVINLIKSHSESEDSFYDAVEKLAIDEENKGNRLIASEIRSSYQLSKSKKNKTADRSVSDMVFSVQNAGVLPRDKDSALELIDVYKSKIKLRHK